MTTAPTKTKQTFRVYCEIAGEVLIEAADAHEAKEKADRIVTPALMAEKFGDELAVAWPVLAKGHEG